MTGNAEKFSGRRTAGIPGVSMGVFRISDVNAIVLFQKVNPMNVIQPLGTISNPVNLDLWPPAN